MMKEAIAKVLMIGLILLFAAGILSLSAAIFAAGFIAVAVFGAYISIRRWWLRKKGVPLQQAPWETAFSENFSPARKTQDEQEDSVTIIEVEYEEVKEKDKP